jgi:AraC family transcriptional activator of pobA
MLKMAKFKKLGLPKIINNLMKFTFSNAQTNALIEMISFQQESFHSSEHLHQKNLFTIIFNPYQDTNISIDYETIVIEKNAVMTILPEQHFFIDSTEHLVIWRYNREFYCIFHHDDEVNCAGFLFYGSSQCSIVLPLEENNRLLHLQEIFVEEFQLTTTAQEEMLRVLLVRLIIKLTRLAKVQYFHNEDLTEHKFRLYRSFNILVEEHFKKEHSVQFYASILHKSPKTITNLFLKHNFSSPQKVIHSRIMVEAKRMLMYTDQTIKEISLELHFEEPSHFSKFFKKYAGVSPTIFKENKGK